MKLSGIRPRTWIGLTITFVVGIVGFVVYSLYVSISVSVPNAYAMWVAPELVIQHMEANNGAWPGNWEDLRPYYIPGTSIESPSGFENLIERVEIDWTVDVVNLRQSLPTNPDDLRVIWLRDGRDDQWLGAGPNELIYKYLKDGYRDPAPGYSIRIDNSQHPVADSDEY
tara:strand:+ start:536 stop:1042 length:507 start_codon:yes stop_codon:yes gene_type:complete